MSKKIKLSVKMLGKKYPVLENIPITLSANFSNAPRLQDLITELVTQQVQQFNQFREANKLLPYLSNTTITDQAERGKVSFGETYNSETVLLTDAIQTALQAFEDGLFLVFINQHKIENLGDTIELNEDTELMFLRLTALAGGYF
jgi:hypothetical protein